VFAPPTTSPPTVEGGPVEAFAYGDHQRWWRRDPNDFQNLRRRTTNHLTTYGGRWTGGSRPPKVEARSTTFGGKGSRRICLNMRSLPNDFKNLRRSPSANTKGGVEG